MNSIARLGATMTIWIALGAITASLIRERSNGGIAEASLLLLIALVTYAAVTGTQAVWQASQQERKPDRRQMPVSMAKAKHGSHDRVARLVEALEDDELYDLEALLLARENDAQRFGEHDRTGI